MSVDAAIGIASLVIELCDLSAKLYNKYTEQQDQVQRLTDVELDRELAELKTCVSRLDAAPKLPSGVASSVIAEHYQVGNPLGIVGQHADFVRLGSKRSLKFINCISEQALGSTRRIET